MPGARNWSVRNVKLSYGVKLDPWVFCASHGDLAKLSKTMCSKIGTSDPYDACIKILDLAKFAKRLFRKGRIDGPHGPRVSDAFSSLHADEIQYIPTRITIQDGPPPAPHPFRKDVSFSAQQESRLALIPREQMIEDFLFVDIPFSRKLMAREF